MKTDSLLEYALLGLVHQKPMSGYALRTIFATTAMGSFSDSPGSIYPALRRLETRKWVRGKGEASTGLRKRRVYKVTAQGSKALKDWLRQPIGRDDIIRGTAKLMLRFAFIDHALGAAAAARFLAQFADQLSQYVPELEQYLNSHGQKMPLSARLAFECGIGDYKGAPPVGPEICRDLSTIGETIMKIGLYCILGGLCTAIFAIGSGFFIVWLSGIVLVAAFVPVARWGPKQPLGQFAVIFPFAVVVGVICTMSEAYFFLPQSRSIFVRQLITGTAMHAWRAAVLAMLAKYLQLSEDSEWRPRLRGLWGLAPMVLLGGFLYLVYFTVFGGITYVLFTRKYYTNLEQPNSWFWAMEMARGVAMILAALPIIRTLRMPRWQAGIALGILLWIVGGGAGLLLPNPYMATAQRYIHIVEIMTQNVALGISVMPLLRQRDGAASSIRDDVAQPQAV